MYGSVKRIPQAATSRYQQHKEWQHSGLHSGLRSAMDQYLRSKKLPRYVRFLALYASKQPRPECVITCWLQSCGLQEVKQPIVQWVLRYQPTDTSHQPHATNSQKSDTGALSTSSYSKICRLQG